MDRNVEPENPTLPTFIKSYSTSDHYSVANIHSACLFIGKVFHHIEVRCQLVALKDVFEPTNLGFQATKCAIG